MTLSERELIKMARIFSAPKRTVDKKSLPPKKDVFWVFGLICSGTQMLYSS